MGFIIAALLLLAMKRIWLGSGRSTKTPEERLLVDGKKHPPFWNSSDPGGRSAMGVKLRARLQRWPEGHWSGDAGADLHGPACFALDMNSRSYDLDRAQDANQRIMEIYQRNQPGFPTS